MPSWEGHRARCQLLAAEAARRQGDDGSYHRFVDEAATWILHSGSVEHLCLLHLVRARFLRSHDLMDRARQEISEGLHVARQCGLRLFQVELLCEQAELLLACNEVMASEQPARAAYSCAAAANCQFVWGAAQAGQLLGQALAPQKRIREARKILRETLDLRRRIGDPEAETTAKFLASLR